VAKLKITLVRSLANCSERQQINIRNLGLTRRNSSVVREATPELKGMIRKVAHLIKVESR